MIITFNILENLIKRYFLYIFLLIFIVGFLLCFAFLNKSEISFNKIKFALSDIGLFTAAITPNPLSSGGLTPRVEGGLVSEFLVAASLEAKTEEPEITLLSTFPKKAGGLAEIQEILDDIAEKIDIISQEIAELVEENQEAQGEEKEKQEEPIEEEPEEEEKEEEKEKEKEKKEEEGICPDGIDINTAPEEELEKIAGVGSVIAQRIIETRPFSSIYDLTRVSGIGEKTLQNIIEQGCAYVEGDTGSDSSGFISVSGGSGGGALPSSTVVHPEILISEVKIAEKIGDKNIFIELYNPNEIEVDLTDWYILRNDSSFIIKTLLEGKKIPIKGYFLITRNGAIWENQADVLFDDKTLNEDDKIALKNPNEEVVDEISWSQIPSGFSFGRKWDGQNYGDFEIQTPTPKAENSSLPLPWPILEISANSLSFEAEGEGENPESQFLTIRNKGEGDLNWIVSTTYSTNAPTSTNWLSVGYSATGTIPATASSTLEFSADISGLELGGYQATTTIEAFDNQGNPAQNSPQEIEVILTVIEKVLEDTTPPEVIFNLEPVQTSLSFTLSWTAADLAGSATPSGLEAFYLQYSVIPPIPPGDAAIVQYENQAGEWWYWPILGDLNNDQNVNLADDAILSSFWMNQDCAEPDWCEGADFNKDGQVNIFDLMVFKSYWLRKNIGEMMLDSQKTVLNVLGKDEYTYNFQIRAKDKAGNFSEWQEAITTINLPKKVLINEIQIDSQFGDGGTEDDWVELYNPNEWEIDLSQWSIQGSPKSGTIYKKNFESEHRIPANGYFLVVRNDANQDLLNLADMT